MRVRFRTEAVSDVTSARNWYEAQRPGLGLEFVRALEQGIELIADHPQASPEFAKGTRRTLLSRFPYAVYYRTEDEVVEVLACLHMRRSPSHWRERG